MRDVDPTTGRRTATDRRAHVRMTAGFFTAPGKLDHVIDPVERQATLALHAASIGMCYDQGTDGHIVPEAVLGETGLPPQFAKTLMTDGLWHQAGHGCPRCPQPRLEHVYVHDYLLHNRTAEQEQRTIESRRRAGERGLSARWEGHEKPQRSNRGPGRPRKNPLPQPPAEPVMHPAEAKARRGRPKKATATEPVTYEPIVLELCQELAEMVTRNGFSIGKIGPAWWKPCEQLLRIGPPNANAGVSPEQVRKAIRWANEDAFWWENIRSMQQLREKYEQLRSAAKNPRRPKRGQAGVIARRGATVPPAAVAVSGMAGMLARQMGAAQGGMVKGAQG